MPPRRQPPAPAGESKTGLVVALVIFVLLFLVAGTLAYMFYAENAAALTAKNDAVAEKKTQQDLRTANELKRSMCEIYLGIETPADRETFSNLKSDQKTYNAYLGRLNAAATKVGITWNTAEDKPSDTLLAKIEKLTTDLKNAKDQFDSAQASFTSTKTGLEGSADQSKQAATAAQKAQAEAGKNELAAKNAKQAELADALTTIATLRDTMAELNKKKEGTEVDFQKRIRTLEETIKDKDVQIRKYSMLLDQKRENILETDHAKGRITRVDNRTNTAYVNIGSADFARPQLTFSVLAPLGSSQAAGKRERKGAIEIVKILGEHLSQVRITDVTNALQEPILEGDLLFNPAWDPSSREHIALAGLFDLNGDGLDDTLDLVRSLEKQGTQIDAYLDLRENAIKGSGITTTTSYLVLGELPTAGAGIAAGAAAGPTDEREKKKADMLARVQEMKDLAARFGVQIVQGKQFLRSTGYSLPKNPVPPNFVPAGAAKNPFGSDAPKAPPAAKKTDDEGK